MPYDPKNKLRLIKDVEFSTHFKAETWEDYNRQFFNQLAKKYDATNVLHSFGTKHRMDRAAVARLPIKQGSKILDLCTGSGDIALAIATQFPDSKVVGVDYSENMLELAAKKTAGLKSVSYQQGDVTRLPFPDGAFDGAIISFGLRNLADLRVGLREFRRVIRPGGFFCNIDQGKPQNALFRLAYKVYFYHIAPLIGKLVFHRGEFNSFRYLPESNKYFPDQREMEALFIEAGFKNVKTYGFWMGAVAQQIAEV
jgi:demethylmenaquinone methyltransferase / 2-methoxy-6-polyprenyl-1,4-benzoquinol methylase